MVALILSSNRSSEATLIWKVAFFYGVVLRKSSQDRITLPQFLYFWLSSRWCSLLENGIRAGKIARLRQAAHPLIFARTAMVESGDWRRILMEVFDD